VGDDVIWDDVISLGREWLLMRIGAVVFAIRRRWRRRAWRRAAGVVADFSATVSQH